MNFLQYPMLTSLLSTVDRIEGEYAILEWENLALSAMHASLFPFELQEGMQVKITLYPSPIGSAYASKADPCILLDRHTIIIPIPNLVIPGLHYSYYIKEQPWIGQP